MTLRRPIKGTPHAADTENLYRGLADVTAALDALGSGTTTTTDEDTNPFSDLAPCTPDFVIDRVVDPAGEDPICCVNYPQGTPATVLKTVIRQFKKDGVTLQSIEKKITNTFEDITDANNDAGILNYRFGKYLPFNKNFALWQLIMTDEAGHKIKARDEGSNTPLALFSTGNATLGPPNGQNLLRNGRFERSKRYSVTAAVATANGWTAPVEGQEAWAWFINCDRERPLTTSTYVGTVARPNSVNPIWDKANGIIKWSSLTSGPSQRLPHRILRASDIVYISGWLSKSFVIGPALGADLTVSIMSVDDQRPGSAGLILTPLASATTRIGAPASLAVVPPPTLSTISMPFQISIQMPSTYTVASTPTPDNDSSGQWVWLQLSNLVGGGQFQMDRLRLGYGDADWSPHPDENGDGVNDVEITGGGGRGGGSDFSATSNSIEPGQGLILRPRTD